MSIPRSAKQAMVAAATGATVLAVFALGARDADRATATTPGPNGPIVYAKQVHGDFQLFSVGPGGTGQRRLP